MSGDDPAVPIVCTECGTRSRVALSTVAEALTNHNDRLHDGETVAQVDPDVVAHVTDLVAEDVVFSDEE